MTFRRKVCMAVLLACASACSQNTPPPEPAAFSRPTRVAFVCVDKSKVVDDPQYLVELSRCDTRTTQAVLNPPAIEEGKAILRDSGLAVIPADGMKDAAEKIIAAVKKGGN